MLTLIKNATLVNEGEIYKADVLIEDKTIKQIDAEINIEVDQIIDAEGLHLLPGVIDDQVHFREPGLTHKANIYTESKAAVAGGITSFMEMPNTNPQALTQELLEDKYQIAAKPPLQTIPFLWEQAMIIWKKYLKLTQKQLEQSRFLWVRQLGIC